MSDERGSGTRRNATSGGGADAGGRAGGERGPRRDGSREPRQVRVSPARIVAYEVLEAVRDRRRPTRTCSCPTASSGRASAPKTPHSRPSSATALCECRASTTPSSRSQRADRPIASTRRCSTSCGSVRTSCSPPGCRRTPRSTSRSCSPSASRPVPTGFVNAVLRTISRTSPEEWREHVERETPGGADAKLAAVSSHPKWIVRALRAALAARGPRRRTRRAARRRQRRTACEPRRASGCGCPGARRPRHAERVLAARLHGGSSARARRGIAAAGCACRTRARSSPRSR